jgi:hypothetical protein
MRFWVAPGLAAVSLLLAPAYAVSAESDEAEVTTQAVACNDHDNGQANAWALFAGSAVCAVMGDAAGSAYLLHIGQIRSIADLMSFRPQDDEGNARVAELFEQLTGASGGLGDASIYADEEKRMALFARIKAWKPAAVRNYDPGWTYAQAPKQNDYVAIVNDVREGRLKQLEEAASLLSIDAYRTAALELNEIQSRHPEGIPRESDDALRLQELVETMQRIADEAYGDKGVE